ncbi:MAG: hypothetical protein NVV59_01110 [Chitinophagaceae bacterium]|nr:hypothetical protein [Chitinophagaceae bacterium]
MFTVGVLAALGATLTAPGIAGLVLTIGMAVDTNVIIYERIKEELARGKSYLTAVNDGYRRSLPPVLDGHITTHDHCDNPFLLRSWPCKRFRNHTDPRFDSIPVLRYPGEPLDH